MADGASTLDELITEYGDNADYAASASVTKARAFETVLRVLLGPAFLDEVQKESSRYRFDKSHLRAELSAVQSWLAVNDTTRAPKRVRHPNLNYLRS